jgi:hypothetical protein
MIAVISFIALPDPTRLGQSSPDPGGFKIDANCRARARQLIFIAFFGLQRIPLGQEAEILSASGALIIF